MAWTNKQIFERVRDHLLSQKSRSYSDGGLCAYRGHDGMKCAIGVLISDECYHPDIERNLIGSERVLEALVESGVIDANRDLLHRSGALHLLTLLQGIHDWQNPRDWAYELNRIEESFF